MKKPTVIHSYKTPNQEKHILVSIITKVKSQKDFMYLDKLKDGTWSLCYSNDMLKDVEYEN